MVQHHFLPAFLLASNLYGFAYAQTYTSCNPTIAICPSNPGLQQKELTLDFTKVKALPAEWTTENLGQATYGADGAKLILSKPNDSLNIISNFYMLFGSISFKVRAAGGKGIVSSVVLISDALDEIDWEIVSKDNSIAESNYFGKGDTGVFDRGGKHPAPDNQNTWHTYRLDWTPEAVTWSLDGQAVRTLRYADAKGGSRFPQTPMRVKIGAWAAGDASGNEKGVVEWSGGPTDWAAAPFVMAVESVKLVNYSPAKEYIYTDRSGSFSSIKLVDGTLMSNGESAPPPPPPAEKPTTSVSGPPPPPISSLKPSVSRSTAASSISAITASVSASRVASTVSPSVTGNATATISKPAVATTNAAIRSLIGSGAALGAFALAVMPML